MWRSSHCFSRSPTFGNTACLIDRDCDEDVLNMIQNLRLNLSITSDKKDVRVLSAKGNPGLFGRIHHCSRASTLLSEDAFEVRSQAVHFKMKLRDHKKYLSRSKLLLESGSSRQEICEKVDQEISSPTCKQLREHLSSYPFRSAYYDTLKETILLYRKDEEKLRGSQVKKILSHIRMSEAAEVEHKRKNRMKHK